MATPLAKVKKVSGEKKLRAHPPYAEMIKEAIGSLKERSGSSQIAISKFIEEKHKVQNLAPNYKKLLLSQLKKLVASGTLVKVKHSFKLGAPTKPKKAETKPKKAETKPKKSVTKPKKAETKSKKSVTKPKKAKAAVTPVKAKKVVVKVMKATPKKADVVKAKKKVATPAAKKVVMKAKSGVKRPKSIKSRVKKPSW